MKKTLFLIKFYSKVRKVENDNTLLKGMNKGFLKSDLTNAFTKGIIDFNDYTTLVKIVNKL